MRVGRQSEVLRSQRGAAIQIVVDEFVDKGQMHVPILQPFEQVGRPTPDSSVGGSAMLRRFVALVGVAATVAVVPASSGDARPPVSDYDSSPASITFR